jgi:hypothetical protein
LLLVPEQAGAKTLNRAPQELEDGRKDRALAVRETNHQRVELFFRAWHDRVGAAYV